LKAASIAFILVAAGIMILLVLPLAVFAAEMVTKGNLFSITYYVTSNRTLVIDLKYNGSIPLKSFNATLVCGGWSQSFYKAEVVKGDVVKMEFNLPGNFTLEKAAFYIEFKIDGIYGVRVGVLNVKS